MRHRLYVSCDPASCRARLERAFAHYAAASARYLPEVEWLTPDHARVAFTVRGHRLQGALRLFPGVVELELEVPWSLRVFRRAAVSRLEREAASWLPLEQRSA